MDARARLLIIDDEEIVLKSCLRILEGFDYKVDTVTSGTEGLAQLKKNDYDIVITDLKMPDISGIDVLKAIRTNYPDIVVIMFTGYATVDSVREALKTGAFDYIPKPFNPEEFSTVVENACSIKKNRKHGKAIDLMAIISHELKSPVSAVHMSADTLYKGYFGKIDSAQESVLKKIIRNCQYLEDIIRNYIDLSKMELDNLQSFNKKINLIDDVIEPIIELSENFYNLKKMQVITRYQARPMVLGDPDLLKIVITNLLDNAIKYGYEETPIEIDVYVEKGRIVFSIFNRGIGVLPDDIENKLFIKFSRLKQKGTERTKGSGLGLYICKKIIDKHDGKIWAESSPGEWIKICFSIPA